MRLSLYISGSPTWARTTDPMINSHLLYQLSYRGTFEEQDCIEASFFGQHPICNLSPLRSPVTPVAIRLSGVFPENPELWHQFALKSAPLIEVQP
jgi:hypothetical protein